MWTASHEPFQKADTWHFLYPLAICTYTGGWAVESLLWETLWPAKYFIIIEEERIDTGQLLIVFAILAKALMKFDLRIQTIFRKFTSDLFLRKVT